MSDTLAINILKRDSIAPIDSMNTILNDSIAAQTVDSTKQVVTQPIITEKFQAIEHLRNIPLDNWTIIALLGAIIILGVAININTKLWNNNLQSIWNQATAERVFREKTTQNNLFNTLIELLAYLSLSIFLIQASAAFQFQIPIKSSVLYVVSFFIVALFINLKSFIYYLLGKVFDVQTASSEYNFHREQRNQWIGIFLLPIIITTAVVPLQLAKTLAIIGLLIIIFFNIISALRGIRIFINKAISIYYLILYLCTLEILPLLVVGKILELA